MPSSSLVRQLLLTEALASGLAKSLRVAYAPLRVAQGRPFHQPAARHCMLQDRQLATHVLAVHKEGCAPPPAEGPAPLSPELLRAYIAAAKQHEPHFPRDRDLTGARARALAFRPHIRLDVDIA